MSINIISDYFSENNSAPQLNQAQETPTNNTSEPPENNKQEQETEQEKVETKEETDDDIKMMTVEKLQIRKEIPNDIITERKRSNILR